MVVVVVVAVAVAVAVAVVVVVCHLAIRLSVLGEVENFVHTSDERGLDVPKMEEALRKLLASG